MVKGKFGKISKSQNIMKMIVDPRKRGNYSSLASRRDVTVINFLRIFQLQLCYFSHCVYQNGPNFAPPRLLQAPHLSKSNYQVVQLPTTPFISATASLKIRERFRFSDKSVKIKLLNAWPCTRNNKSFECTIVINYFESIYCQMYIRLNTSVLLIQFYSIE